MTAIAKRLPFSCLIGAKDCNNTLYSTTQAHIYGLDGMRAIAVALVFFGHYGLIGAGAMFGVQVFFVVSGFIITRVLLKEYFEIKTIDIKRFYVRRFLRLGPMLLISVVVVVILWTIVGRPLDWSAISASVFYYANYYQIYVNSDLYYMPLWSLAIEEHFYFFFPVLLVLGWSRSRSLFLGAVIAAIVVVLVWRSGLTIKLGADASRHIYLGSDTRIDSLLFGVTLAAITSTKWPQVFDRWFSGVSACVGVVMLVVCYLIRDAVFRSTLMYTLQGAGLALLMGYILFDSGVWANLIRRMLEGEIARYVGKISYSLYLWHLPLLMIATTYFGPSFMVRAIAFLVSIVLAVISYEWVERPLLSVRHRFGSHAR